MFSGSKYPKNILFVFWKQKHWLWMHCQQDLEQLPYFFKYSNALRTSQTCSFAKWYHILHPFETPWLCARYGIKSFHDVILHPSFNQCLKTLLFEYVAAIRYCLPKFMAQQCAISQCFSLPLSTVRVLVSQRWLIQLQVWCVTRDTRCAMSVLEVCLKYRVAPAFHTDMEMLSSIRSHLLSI